jgi:adenine-specific DNA-methyltransferase
MRYLGSKENLLNFIDEALRRHNAVSTAERPLSLCDPFTGTTSVARHLKRQDWQVVTGDLMAYSYAFQHAYIALNEAPTFTALLDAGALDSSIILPMPLQRVIAHLNNLRGIEGFCYWHYSPDGPEGRRYFTAANALRIDAIRGAIKDWWEMGWLMESERYLLLTCLIEAVSRVANVAGTYAAYLKGWDSRAHKPLILHVPALVYSAHEHSVNMADANELVSREQFDLLYIDPPYNARQYCTNYHLLETLAMGDEPEVTGVSGLRPSDGKRSAYCKTGEAESQLSALICSAQANWILLSYNSEGIIPSERIIEILSEKGNVEVYNCAYPRYRSDADSDSRRYQANSKVQEMLYWVTTGDRK